MTTNEERAAAAYKVFAPLDQALDQVDEKIRDTFAEARIGLGKSVDNALRNMSGCRLTAAMQAAYQVEQFAGDLQREAVELAAEANIGGDEFAELLRTARGVWTERLPDAMAAMLVKDCGCSIRPS